MICANLALTLETIIPRPSISSSVKAGLLPDSDINEVFTSLRINNSIGRMSIRHSININEDTFEELKKYGKFGETYDDIISRVLKEYSK